MTPLKKLLLASTAHFLLIPTVLAQDDGFVLEEIVVTASKRVETLQSVSIAVSVVAGERLEAAGITTMEELSSLVPAVLVAPTPSGDSIFIRGVGSGINRGFEMSVGTFIDDVYFGRGRSARNPFLDVERVEVLKGPQGTLFGKNTIGGAFNITTRKPVIDGDRDGYVDALWDPEYDTWQVTAATSIPLADRAAFRLVGRTNGSDGYIRNTLTDTNEPRKDDWVVRGTFVWDATASFDVSLKAEVGAFDLVGRSSQLASNNPTRLGINIVTLLQSLGSDPDVEGNFDYQKSGPSTDPNFPQYSNNDTYHGSLTLAYSFENGSELKSITALSGYDVDEISDSDFTNLAFIQQVKKEEWDFFSQEVRLTSAGDEAFSYIAGLFYAAETLHSEAASDLNGPAIGSPLPPVTRFNVFDQDTDTLALFAEVTWEASASARLIGGLRYTSDKKTAKKRQLFAQLFGREADPALTAFYDVTLGGLVGRSHDFGEMKRSEDNFSPQIKLEWDASDDWMTYFSFSKGFKAGGFDEDNAAGNRAVEEFDAENVDAFELGLKGTLLDGRGRLNMSIFQSNYSNLQVSTFDGAAAFIVGNAAEARTRGVELDITIQATESLRLGADTAYLDAEYTDYKEGPTTSTNGGLPDCAPGAATVSTNAAGLPTACDLTGFPLQFAPKWSGTIYADFGKPLSDSLELVARADVVFSSVFTIAADADENLKQQGYAKVNMRLGVNSDTGWSLAVVGKNLFNEKTATWGNDIPLGSTVFGNNYFKHIDPPRSVSIQARLAF